MALTVMAAASLELVAAALAIVFALIGLAGDRPLEMAATATIAIGAALLVQGLAVTVRCIDSARRVVGGQPDRREVRMLRETVAGIGAIALGDVALAGVSPLRLVALATILVGGTLFVGAPAHPVLAAHAPDPDRRIGRYTLGAVLISTRVMTFTGLASVVTGALVVIRIVTTPVVVLAVLLAISSALVLTGGALSARFARHARQR